MARQIFLARQISFCVSLELSLLTRAFALRYSLACSQLSPGDVCISLAHAEHQKPSLVHAEHQRNSLVHAEHQNNTSVNQGLRLNQDGAHGPRSGHQGHQRSNNSQQSTSSYPSRLPPPIQTAKADT